MIQQPYSASSYTVKPNEVISIQVQAIKVAPFCSAAVDGSPCPATSTDPITYTIKAPGTSGQLLHFVFYGTFLPNPPDGAAMILNLQGDQGGGVFQGPALFPGNINGDVGIVFGVQA